MNLRLPEGVMVLLVAAVTFLARNAENAIVLENAKPGDPSWVRLSVSSLALETRTI